MSDNAKIALKLTAGMDKVDVEASLKKVRFGGACQGGWGCKVRH